MILSTVGVAEDSDSTFTRRSAASQKYVSGGLIFWLLILLPRSFVDTMGVLYTIQDMLFGVSCDSVSDSLVMFMRPPSW